MAKFLIDAAMDAELDYIADNGDKLHVCTTQPANYAGIAAVELASVALTAGDGLGDYTIADGDTSGRKLTLAAQNGLTATASGTAAHIAISNGTDTLLLVDTLSSSQSVTSGNTVNVAAFDLEITDVS